ncbi:MAG: peptide deformylase [Cyanobacteriota bacterium]|nr:peptide deformylase [Cyanobacteriota bacterium]
MQILKIGHPKLRSIAHPISPIDREIQRLIERLLATIERENGVGIAAPQVSRSFRLFIVASRPNPRYPDAPSMKPTAMINPQIITTSEEKVFGWEGCLSVPNIRGRVPRYQTIEVEYLDRNGDLCHDRLTDFVARIFQHEYDHLEGVLFPDRIETSQDLVSEKEFFDRIVPAQLSSKAPSLSPGQKSGQ